MLVLLNKYIHLKKDVIVFMVLNESVISFHLVNSEWPWPLPFLFLHYFLVELQRLVDFHTIYDSIMMVDIVDCFFLDSEHYLFIFGAIIPVEILCFSSIDSLPQLLYIVNQIVILLTKFLYHCLNLVLLNTSTSFLIYFQSIITLIVNNILWLYFYNST